MKHVISSAIILFVLTCIVTRLPAQTLFSYGDQRVSKQEFLQAYSKNNTTGKPTEKSYRDYLDLYTRYKLKVREAYDLKLDTLPNQVTELKNFRNQIVDQYMTDENSMNRLVDEAFSRRQKDIHLAHIFVAVHKNAGPSDTLKAYKKAMEAYGALKSGKDFAKVALDYSEDPFVGGNQGDIGFITVFTLPYDLETLAYQTPPGKFSKPYRSASGYHIFKNLGERKALGKLKVAQLLLVFPYQATEAEKAEVKQRADSLYYAILKGSDFKELVKKFSGDNLSYQSGGELPEFTVGKYDASFEQAAFALTKEGEISQPVPSSFGYHIIKLLARDPVGTDKDKKTMDALRQQVKNDPRIEISKKEMLQTILRLTHFRQNTINEDHLWAFADSSLKGKNLPRFPDLHAATTLFVFPKKNISVNDWIDYRKSTKNIPDLISGKTNKELLDQYRQAMAFEYYRDHLEDYNKEFAYQLNEFRDGNLLFEIMQHKVWDKASTDSMGLRNYFEGHLANYFWQPSADAIIFTCANEKAAHEIMTKLPNNIDHWKRLVDSSNGLAQADSGRFELSQLPPAETNHLQAGQFTALSTNQVDNTITLAYLVAIYQERMPRSFADARGLVINDYQAFIEDKWINELKKKYPVKINEQVLKSMID